MDKMARAGTHPEPHFLDMYYAACSAALPAFSLAQLALLARAMRTLELEAPPEWTASMMEVGRGQEGRGNVRCLGGCVADGDGLLITRQAPWDTARCSCRTRPSA